MKELTKKSLIQRFGPVYTKKELLKEFVFDSNEPIILTHKFLNVRCTADKLENIYYNFKIIR